MTDEFKNLNIEEQSKQFLTEAEIRALISNELTNFTATSRVKSGLLQSGNFVSGSTGWKLDANGDSEMGSGTFRGTITGSTITGGTVQTATSGERIVMTSNTLKAYDSSDTVLFSLLNSTLESLKLYSDVNRRAMTLYENTNAAADVIYMIMGAGTGRAINIVNTGVNTTDLVKMQTSSGVGLHIIGTDANAGLVNNFIQLDLDKTGFFFGNQTTSNPNNVGLMEIVADSASGALGTCLYLYASVNNYSHIRFAGGGSGPTSPADGDFWFDGTDLKIRSGGVTYTLTKT